MNLQPGDQAPDFRIATVGGVSRTLRDYAGAPVVLYGWGSWHPSRDALDTLRKFQADHPGVRVLSVAFDAQGPGVAMRYLKPVAPQFEMLIDATCVLSRAWGVKDLPVTVVLDAEGFVLRAGTDFDPGEVAEALDSKVERRGERAFEKPGKGTEIDVKVQGCAIHLSRGRTKDAADSLRAALELDPDNAIIRGQIPAVEDPAKVYGS